MKTLLFWCLITLFVGLPIYLCYWNLFREVLIKRLKYRLFQVRDDLRMLLISGEMGENEKAYPLVEKFCNRAILKIDEIDFTDFFLAKLDKQDSLEMDRDLEIIFGSNVEIRRHFIHMVFVIGGVAAANSPGLLLLTSPVLVFSITALWFTKVKNWFSRLIKKGMGSVFLKPVNC